MEKANPPAAGENPANDEIGQKVVFGGSNPLQEPQRTITPLRIFRLATPIRHTYNK